MTPFELKRASLSCAALGLTLVLAACASEPRYPIGGQAPPPPPAQPVPQPSPPPPPPPPRDPEVPLGSPSTPVQSAPLPPVGRPVPRAAPPTGGTVAPTSGPNGQPSPWAQPTAVADTPSSVTVGRGETLFDVAERVRTPVRALIEINELQPPYTLPPGTVLKIPPPLFYTVGEGDTLFGIARRFNIDPRSLANLNSIQLETAIRRGQRIALPSLARDQGANAQANGASPPGSGGARLATATPAQAPNRYPRSPVSGAPPTASVPGGALEGGPTVAAAPTDAQVAAAGRGKFSWPVKGDVISTFGPKGPGQRNDGLNIAAGAGDAVHAAAPGEVVFAGDLPGFGNLVLLKHQGGFVTAYAHLSKIDVKMRDTVAQGQEVGLAGQTGQVDRPQVHFEIRYAANPRDKARPVDPSLLLPGAG